MWALWLWLGCSCWPPALGLDAAGRLLPPGDTVSEHMLRLYERYSGGRQGGPGPQQPFQQQVQDGNTVRSFRALPARGSAGGKELHIFNLTSLTKSENILSATLHYHIGDSLNASWRCTHSRGCARHDATKPEVQLDLTMWSFTAAENQTRTLGHFIINVSPAHQDYPSWQWKDITEVLREAKQKDELLIGVNITAVGTFTWKKSPSSHGPYILVYANDSTISEPDSVSSLQGHRNSLAIGPGRLARHSKSSVVEQRRKRSTNILLPLQNNELPGAEYQYNEGWEERKPYKTLQTQPAERTRTKKKPRKSSFQNSQTLQFDEPTLKKARRKRSNGPRNCARRDLKVDFAEIGWNDWIIAPSSFDAYYCSGACHCSGACQCPLPKPLKESNHAIIQSLLRAMGVVPGITEPCCVPEKMSSLSVLYLDDDNNVVLKVYRNMIVESCACK